MKIITDYQLPSGEILRRGTGVEIVRFGSSESPEGDRGDDLVLVELPDGRQVEVPQRILG